MTDIEKHIDHLLENPDALPDLELVHYAAERNWIGIRHLNYCINAHGNTRTSGTGSRHLLREIHYLILRSYLLEKRQKCR